MQKSERKIIFRLNFHREKNETQFRHNLGASGRISMNLKEFFFSGFSEMIIKVADISKPR